MNAPKIDELRQEGMVIVDCPDRKIMVYPNFCGLVVLLAIEDGKRAYTMIEPSEVAAICAALTKTGVVAQGIMDEIDADYDKHLAREEEKGCA